MVLGQSVVCAEKLPAVVALEGKAFLLLATEVTLHVFFDYGTGYVFTYLVHLWGLRKH